MASDLEIIDEKASTQWSLITRQQLLEEMIPPARVVRLLQSGALRRVGRHVYATFGSPRSWEQSVMAAVLAAGPEGVASHAAAARLWQFVYRPDDAIELTVPIDPTDTSWSRRGLHRTRILPADDVTERSGIPCTTFERTLCDCTTSLSPLQLGRVLDDGLRRGDASLGRLLRCSARLDSGPGRRLGVVKALLSERDSSFDPGGSASELYVLRVLRDAGVPEPVQQHPVRVNGRNYVLDFAWPEQRVCVEYYGLAVHSGASAVAHDSVRMTALVAAGWRPLVFTDRSSDREIVERVRALLETDQSDWAVSGRRGA